MVNDLQALQFTADEALTQLFKWHETDTRFLSRLIAVKEYIDALEKTLSQSVSSPETASADARSLDLSQLKAWIETNPKKGSEEAQADDGSVLSATPVSTPLGHVFLNAETSEALINADKMIRGLRDAQIADMAEKVDREIMGEDESFDPSITQRLPESIIPTQPANKKSKGKR